MANQKDQFEDTLKSTFFMDFEHPSIQEKAQELTNGIEDDLEKAKSQDW